MTGTDLLPGGCLCRSEAAVRLLPPSCFSGTHSADGCAPSRVREPAIEKLQANPSLPHGYPEGQTHLTARVQLYYQYNNNSHGEFL